MINVNFTTLYLYREGIYTYTFRPSLTEDAYLGDKSTKTLQKLVQKIEGTQKQREIMACTFMDIQ